MNLTKQQGAIDIVVTFCNDCERPWGVILPRAHDEVDELRAERALHRTWVGRPDEQNPPPLETLTTRNVVFIHPGDVQWFRELGLEAPTVGWNDADVIEAPAWWLNKRRRRAVCWHCCAIDIA